MWICQRTTQTHDNVMNMTIGKTKVEQHAKQNTANMHTWTHNYEHMKNRK